MAPPSLKADPDFSDATAEAEAEDTAEAGASTAVPLPADTIGRAKSRPAGPSGAGRADSAASADATPPFAPSRSAASTSATEAYSGSSYSGTAYASPSGYSRSDWSTGLDSTTAPAGSSSSATSVGGFGPVRSASSGAAPPGATGAAAPSGNRYSNGNGYLTNNSFSSGAASAASTVSGAAAGLANSVTSAWQKRGSTRETSPRGTQTRKSTKRQAMLTLARVEPWSVMKFSFVASVVAFIILFVAVAVLYIVLSALGVFDSLQHTVSSITGSQSASGTNISHYYSASLVLGYTAMLGALNIVLITAMSTVGSVIYNLIAKTIGGIEVTLRETD